MVSVAVGICIFGRRIPAFIRSPSNIFSHSQCGSADSSACGLATTAAPATTTTAAATAMTGITTTRTMPI